MATGNRNFGGLLNDFDRIMTRAAARGFNQPQHPDDIEIQDLVRDVKRYYNAVKDEQIPFDLNEYQTMMNSIPVGQLKSILNTDYLI